MDTETKKLLEQLLLDIDACLYGKGATGTTLRTMKVRISNALETPEEKADRIERKHELMRRALMVHQEPNNGNGK